MPHWSELAVVPLVLEVSVVVPEIEPDAEPVVVPAVVALVPLVVSVAAVVEVCWSTPTVDDGAVAVEVELYTSVVVAGYVLAVVVSVAVRVL